MFITNEVPLHTGAMSVLPYSESLENRYKFITRFGDPGNMSIRSGNRLLVPRETVPLGKEDRRPWYVPTAIDCTLTPRNPEQVPLSEQSLMLLNGGISHVFNAPTGWGKTVAGSYIAAKLGQPTLIVVTKNDLTTSWYKALTEVLKIPPSKIGRIQQDVCVWEGKQFVIGMVHSLIIPDRYPEKMYRHFGLMILDEVHLMAADSFSRICTKVPARARLGFSATPDRSDGKWKVIEAHIGPVKVKGSMVPMAPKILVKKTQWAIPVRKTYQDGMQTMAKIPFSAGRMMSVVKAQASSNPRNLQIVEFILAAHEAGRRTLVLADTKDHLERLFQMLTSSGLGGQDIGHYVGGKTSVELDIAKVRPVILGTYKMCSTGTDVPIWDTLVLATPKSDVKQAVGRVLRTSEGKKQPVVLDLLDGDAIFSAFYKARLKFYFSIGAEVVRME